MLPYYPGAQVGNITVIIAELIRRRESDFASEAVSIKQRDLSNVCIERTETAEVKAYGCRVYAG